MKNYFILPLRKVYRLPGAYVFPSINLEENITMPASSNLFLRKAGSENRLFFPLSVWGKQIGSCFTKFLREHNRRKLSPQAIFSKLGGEKAQTAVEYMLLLAAVVSIVLVGFRLYLPRVQETSNIYFNRVSYGIMGEPPRCGDLFCCAPLETIERCPPDCDGSPGTTQACPPALP